MSLEVMRGVGDSRSGVMNSCAANQGNLGFSEKNIDGDGEKRGNHMPPKAGLSGSEERSPYVKHLAQDVHVGALSGEDLHHDGGAGLVLLGQFGGHLRRLPLTHERLEADDAPLPQLRLPCARL